MRYFIFANPEANSLKIAKYIRKRLDANQNFVFDEKTPEIVVSVGGDGCMLRCVHHFENRLNDTAFVGVSSGNLGFLCDYKASEVDEFLDAILTRTPKYDSCRMVEVKTNKFHQVYLNEARVEKMFNTLMTEVYINGEFFERFRGNGLNFATPTGSTAYNRSLGGPVVHPRNPVLIMGEIAAINHNVYRSLNSFLILRDSDVITLKGNFKDCIIGGDTIHSKIEEVDEKCEQIEIKLSRECVIFARYRLMSYYNTIKKSFISGSGL